VTLEEGIRRTLEWMIGAYGLKTQIKGGGKRILTKK